MCHEALLHVTLVIYLASSKSLHNCDRTTIHWHAFFLLSSPVRRPLKKESSSGTSNPYGVRHPLKHIQIRERPKRTQAPLIRPYYLLIIKEHPPTVIRTYMRDIMARMYRGALMRYERAQTVLRRQRDRDCRGRAGRWRCVDDLARVVWVREQPLYSTFCVPVL